MGTNFKRNLLYMRPYQWTLEGLSVLLGLVAVVVAMVGRSKLPEEVPTHWDFQGNPDGYGSPTTFVFLPLIMLTAILATSAIIHFTDPSVWNMPFQMQGERKVIVVRTLITILLLVNLEMALFSLWFTLRSIQLNMEGALLGTILFVAVLTVTLVVGIALAAAKNK